MQFAAGGEVYGPAIRPAFTSFAMSAVMAECAAAVSIGRFGRTRPASRGPVYPISAPYRMPCSAAAAAAASGYVVSSRCHSRASNCRGSGSDSIQCDGCFGGTAAAAAAEAAAVLVVPVRCALRCVSIMRSR